MSESDKGKPLPPAKQAFIGAIPHMRELGLEPLEGENGVAVMRLPWQEKLVGDPETGIIHGGVVTTLIDSVAGLAVLTAIDKPQPMATLDLRIDYLRPATPHIDLFARAEAYRVTRQVVFVRASAYHEGEDAGDNGAADVASAAGTFMLTGRLGPKSGNGEPK